VLNITASIGTIAAGVIWGYVMDRIGVRTFGALMMVAGPLCTLAWFFLSPGTVTVWLPVLGTLEIHQPIFVIAGINLLAGALFSGVGLAQVNLANALAPKEGRTMAMAIHWTIIGGVAAIGPLAGGWIMDWVEAHPFTWMLPMGVPFSYFHILIIMHILLSIGVGVPALLQVRRPQNLKVTEAIGRLMLGNPLRLAVSIYNIYASGVGADAAQRAKAVRKLGESRTEIAVSDLIERLKDPSPDVREEAVFALGAIASPEAVQALVAELESGEGELAPQVARALRTNPLSSAAVPRTVDGRDRSVKVHFEICGRAPPKR
jgi:MFS family permease